MRNYDAYEITSIYYSADQINDRLNIYVDGKYIGASGCISGVVKDYTGTIPVSKIYRTSVIEFELDNTGCINTPNSGPFGCGLKSLTLTLRYSYSN